MQGLITVESHFGPKETMERLEADLKAQGMTIFARIDHSQLAAGAGMTLLPTVLIIFGNPRGGTPLMQANQTIGIDLPLKALVWQDASGKTSLSYNHAEWLAKRHDLTAVDKVVGTMNLALGAFAAKAAGHKK
jgi:uncharacterized protein (DUF302 family)